MAEFRLSKWYLDCVTAAGDVSIVYSGRVQWARFASHYSSLIESCAGDVSVRRSFRAIELPTESEGVARWQCDALKRQGVWRTDSATVGATVFACDEGSIEWECLMPRAHATIGTRTGLGYVERLTMTVAPWKLPLRTLRWGRFLTASEWVVWIDWQGTPPRRHVYRNGAPCETLSLEDGRIVFDDGAQLHLDRSLVLRSGALGSTALRGIPGLGSSLPGRLLQVSECKWRSWAKLEQPGREPVAGWAIHEKVEWPE